MSPITWRYFVVFKNHFWNNLFSLGSIVFILVILNPSDGYYLSILPIVLSIYFININRTLYLDIPFENIIASPIQIKDIALQESIITLSESYIILFFSYLMSILLGKHTSVLEHSLVKILLFLSNITISLILCTSFVYLYSYTLIILKHRFVLNLSASVAIIIMSNLFIYNINPKLRNLILLVTSLFFYLTISQIKKKPKNITCC